MDIGGASETGNAMRSFSDLVAGRPTTGGVIPGVVAQHELDMRTAQRMSAIASGELLEVVRRGGGELLEIVERGG